MKQTSQKKTSSKAFILYILIALTGILFALFLFAPHPNYKTGFENIHEVVADANSKKELADPESYKDHRRPSWKTYHSKTQPGTIGKKLNNALALLGLKGRPNWSPSYFKNILEKRIREREAKGKSSSYEYVQRIVPNENAKIVLWGDMSGAYHSMVRALEKLIKLNIIDENLKLTDKNTYFAFMGDVASRSPFIMELLTLIMKLEEKNPDRIIYMTGNNERRGAWYPYGLREEIQFKAPHLTSKNNPLYKVVEKYFETLPLGIYISIPPHTSNEFVRLSHFAMETPSKETYREFVELLDDSYYATELLSNRKASTEDSNIIKLDKDRTSPDVDEVNVRVIIKSFRKMKEYQKNSGLRLLVPDKNATAWTALSSPTVFANKFFNFWDDAFVIIQIAPFIEDWTITLYTRDIRTKDDFRTVKYNFLSGKEISNNTTNIEKVSKQKAKPQDRILRRRR